MISLIIKQQVKLVVNQQNNVPQKKKKTQYYYLRSTSSCKLSICIHRVRDEVVIVNSCLRLPTPSPTPSIPKFSEVHELS